MPMDTFLADATLQAIAAENNLSETAFLVPDGGDYRLRWFTPATEVPLCGHATLASAAVVMERGELGVPRWSFTPPADHLRSNGRERATGWIFRHGPRNGSRRRPVCSKRWALSPAKSSLTPSTIWLCWRAAGVARARSRHGGDCSLRPAGCDRDYGRRRSIRLPQPLFRSRQRNPRYSVTGAAHSMLTPYWANRLNKTTFRAFQSSPRGGEVICRLKGDRVELEGRCVLYLEGEVEI